jgi:soluble lytic murein transglycosylase-like protein
MRRLIMAMGLATAIAVVGARAEAGTSHDVADIQSMIVEAALAFDVDPALALAMAEVESAFDARAESHVGARGVLQIMPATVKGEYALHPDILWDPRINIRIGVHFIRSLLDRYEGQEKFALSWYNGGSRVGPLHRARVIPATAPYVEKVLRKKRKYTQQIAERGLADFLPQMQFAQLDHSETR